ncbi:MAG: hypothetical protein PVF19_13455, partial [Gemmatimonadota bacterium]
MPLVTVLTADPKVRSSVRGPLPDGYTVAPTRSWERLTWLIRERPSTAVVVDSGALPEDLTEDLAVGELRRRFPSLAMLFVVRPGADPVSLFRLGRAGLASLVLLPLDSIAEDLARALRTALRSGTMAIVTRTLSPFIPGRELFAVTSALNGALRGWGTEDVAAHCGLTRPHLSVRLKAMGLPSAG